MQETYANFKYPKELTEKMDQDTTSKDIVQSQEEESILVDPGIISINIICRLCANPNERIIGIYSEEGISNDLANKMNLYLPVKVSENDTLPLQCCWSCASTVLAWHELVIASVEADRRLRDLQIGTEKQTAIVGGDDDDEDYNGIDDDASSSPPHRDDNGYQETSKVSVKREEDYGTSSNDRKEKQTNFDSETGKLIVKPYSMNSYEDDKIGPFLPHEETYITCEICRMTFLKNNDLLFHTKKYHQKTKCTSTVDNRTFCNVCGKGFTTKSRLKIHQTRKHRANQSPKMLQPEVKVKEELLDDVAAIESTTYIPTTATPNQYWCHICDDVFSKKTALNKHLKEHTKRIPRKRRCKSEIVADHFCDICERGFTRKYDMQKHRKSKHPDHSELEEELTQRQKNLQLLNRCKVSSDGDKNYYKCEVCNRLFRQSYNFVRHQSVHTGVRAFFCHICGKNFRVSGGLHRHITEHHYGIKKYECDVCGKCFATKATRDDHRNIHTDERPFICDTCGKAFRQKASLHTHKLFHTDNYRFSCNICGKKYRRASELKIHSWLHTGHKPHECTICGSRFRLKQDLKRHLKIHNKLNECVCNECGSIFSQERYLKNHKKAHRVKNIPFVVQPVT